MESDSKKRSVLVTASVVSAVETMIEPQIFAPFERKGSTVVEWGGRKIK